MKYSRINWFLAGGLIVAGAYQFWILPLFLLPESLLWGFTLVPIALLTNTYWALTHDTFHGSFCTSARTNVAIGRVLCVMFGAPFHMLRLAHLLHHGFNRTPKERIEVYDASKTNRLSVSLTYYFQLLGGLYLQEFLSVWLFLLPKKAILRFFGNSGSESSLLPTMVKKLTTGETLRSARFDSAAIIVVFGSALWAYGQFAWILLLALSARAFFISFADYVYHYNTPLDDVSFGRNLALPTAMSAFFLHFNMHGVHHRNPQTPWHKLPAAFNESSAEYSDTWGRMLLAQLRGPLPLSLMERNERVIQTGQEPLDVAQ